MAVIQAATLFPHKNQPKQPQVRMIGIAKTTICEQTFEIEVTVELDASLPKGRALILKAQCPAEINHKKTNSSLLLRDDLMFIDHKKRFCRERLSEPVKAKARLRDKEAGLYQVVFEFPRWQSTAPIEDGPSIDIIPKIIKLETRLIEE